MKELHDWCVGHKDPIANLRERHEGHNQWEIPQPPKLDGRLLFNASTQIKGVVSTLRSVSSKKNLFKDLAVVMGGGGTTPEQEYIMPAPDFSTGGGFGAVAGLGVDIASGFGALRQETRAMKKELKTYESGDAQAKKALRMDYENMIIRLDALVRLGAQSEDQAEKLFKRGFNVPIANRAWATTQVYSWLVHVA